MSAPAVEIHVGPYAQVMVRRADAGPLMDLHTELSEGRWPISRRFDWLERDGGEVGRGCYYPVLLNKRSDGPRQMMWIADRSDAEIDNILALTPEDVRAEMEWFQKHFAGFFQALADAAGKPADLLWGAVPLTEY